MCSSRHLLYIALLSVYLYDCLSVCLSVYLSVLLFFPPFLFWYWMNVVTVFFLEDDSFVWRKKGNFVKRESLLVFVDIWRSRRNVDTKGKQSKEALTNYVQSCLLISQMLSDWQSKGKVWDVFPKIMKRGSTIVLKLSSGINPFVFCGICKTL